MGRVRSALARSGGLLDRSPPAICGLLLRDRGAVGDTRPVGGFSALGRLGLLGRGRALLALCLLGRGRAMGTLGALRGLLGPWHLRARVGARSVSGLHVLDRLDLAYRRRALARCRLARRRGSLRRGSLGRLRLRSGHLGRRGRGFRRPARQELEGIAVVVVGSGDAHPEVEVRPLGRPLPAGPDSAEAVAGGHLVTPLHVDLRKVEVRRVEPPVRGADRHRPARGSERAGVADRPGRGRANRRAYLTRDVDAAVLPRRVGVAAVAVRRQDLAVDRPWPVPGRLGRRGEGESERRDRGAHHPGANPVTMTEDSRRRW